MHHFMSLEPYIPISSDIFPHKNHSPCLYVVINNVSQPYTKDPRIVETQSPPVTSIYLRRRLLMISVEAFLRKRSILIFISSVLAVLKLFFAPTTFEINPFTILKCPQTTLLYFHFDAIVFPDFEKCITKLKKI